MNNRGWILAFRTGKDKMTQYWFYKTKLSAEMDAERIKSKGWEVVKIFQGQSNCIVIIKEDKT